MTLVPGSCELFVYGVELRARISNTHIGQIIHTVRCRNSVMGREDSHVQL